MAWPLLELWVWEQYRPFSDGLYLGGIVTLAGTNVTPNYLGFTESAQGFTECLLNGFFPFPPEPARLDADTEGTKSRLQLRSAPYTLSPANQPVLKAAWKL